MEMEATAFFSVAQFRGVAFAQILYGGANVGRSTFDAHFQDKESLFLSEFETLRSLFERHLLSQPTMDTSPWNLSLVMFQHAQENRQLYTALAGKQGGSLALTHLQKCISVLLQTHLRQ